LVPGGSVGNLLAAGASAGVGLATFAVIEAMLGLKEVRFAVAWIQRRTLGAVRARGSSRGGIER
jgi:hypothetical protein